MQSALQQFIVTMPLKSLLY